MPFSFWHFRMPNANNGLQGLKHALDNQENETDRRWAEHVADGNQKNLEKALEETMEAIGKRDRGESREDDPDVQDGIRW